MGLLGWASFVYQCSFGTILLITNPSASSSRLLRQQTPQQLVFFSCFRWCVSLLQPNKANKQPSHGWKNDEVELWDAVAWCHLRLSIFPHSRRARLMPHMCSTYTAVLFYSHSYQRMKGRRAQRGVSRHRRAEVRQEGKSQIVEASHMCCTSDEKVRCKTCFLSALFPYCIGHCVGWKTACCFFLKSWGFLVLFCCLMLCWQARSEQISPWGPPVTFVLMESMHSWLEKYFIC